jgi:hypothetical protein
MPALTLPPGVVEVLHDFRTCEFTTMTTSGEPVTWPVTSWFAEDDGTFLVSTSVGFPAKARNVARDSRVSMLFSDPTGSGLTAPPTVLVQGDAVLRDEVVTDPAEWEALCAKVMRFQPQSRMHHKFGLIRRLMDWYYMRLLVTVTPLTITWWPDGNHGGRAEVRHV